MPIYLMRHVQSLFNEYGIPEKDCGITNEWIDMISQISSTYDLVMRSLLRRCKETLEYSNIK